MPLINYAFRHNTTSQQWIKDLHVTYIFPVIVFFLVEAYEDNYALVSVLALKSILGVMCWEIAAARHGRENCASGLVSQSLHNFPKRSFYTAVT